MSYGGVRDDFFNDLEKTNDGGYLLVGSSKSFGPDPDSFDGYIVRTDSSGNELYSSTYFSVGDDAASFIRPSEDSCYYICFNSDIAPGIYRTHLLKVNDTIGLVWDSDAFSAVNAYLYDGCFLPDGNFIALGRMADSISIAIWFNDEGDTIMTKKLSSDDSLFFRRISYNNGSLTIVGYKILQSVFVEAYDLSGSLISHYEMNGVFGNVSSCMNQNGILFNVKTFDPFAIRCSATDTISNLVLWQDTLGPMPNYLTAYNSSLYNENLMICGQAKLEDDTIGGYITVLDAQHGTLLLENYARSNNTFFTCFNNARQFDGHICAVGKQSGEAMDAILYKTDYNDIAGLRNDYFKILNLRIFPNPVDHDLFLSSGLSAISHFRIYDCYGRIVKTGFAGNGAIDVGALANGIYILQISLGKAVISKTFIKN